jgi:hypothetical protein
VDALQQAYIKALTSLFDAHKAKYGQPDDQLDVR